MSQSKSWRQLRPEFRNFSYMEIESSVQYGSPKDETWLEFFFRYSYHSFGLLFALMLVFMAIEYLKGGNSIKI